MQNVEFERREKTRSTFVSQYAPERNDSRHTLLYDYEHTSDYAPTVDELTGCLSDYLALLRVIPEDEPWVYWVWACWTPANSF